MQYRLQCDAPMVAVFACADYPSVGGVGGGHAGVLLFLGQCHQKHAREWTSLKVRNVRELQRPKLPTDPAGVSALWAMMGLGQCHCTAGIERSQPVRQVAWVPKGSYIHKISTVTSNWLN